MQSTLAPASLPIATLALVALAWVAEPARATVMVEVPLEGLVRDADAVVMATVTAVDVQMVIRGQEVEPHTVARLRVDGWLKGQGGSEVRVAGPTGDWGSARLRGGCSAGGATGGGAVPWLALLVVGLTRRCRRR